MMSRTVANLVKLFIGKFLSLLACIVSLPLATRRSAIAPIEDEILLISATELSKKIRSGQLSCEQVVKAYTKRIEKVDPLINAVVDKSRFEQATKEARELDCRLEAARRGTGDKKLLERPLIGVPFTVKETIALEGNSFTGGLPSRRLRRAQRSSEAVQQLMEAGLIPIGSTNTPCMNQWYDSSNMLYGRTSNPYDLARIPGGSSGGEAAALAAACSLVGVGSDLAGSIRIPCSFCGVFGHKPTPFSVSNDGSMPKMKPEQEKLRAVGPMTRYACDLAPMLKLMLKSESELDKMQLDQPVDLRKIKIFYCESTGDPFTAGCLQSELLAGLRAAVEHFAGKFQCQVERTQFEEFRYGLPLWAAELKVAGGDVKPSEHEDARIQMSGFVELLKKLVGASSEYPIGMIATDIIEKLGPVYGSAKHAHLVSGALKLRRNFQELLGEDGVLLMLASPQSAPHHETSLFKFLNCAYTAVCNTLQAPITQCPLGMSHEGLPYGLQIISRPYNDRLTLAVAVELEKTFGGWFPPCKVTLPPTSTTTAPTTTKTEQTASMKQAVDPAAAAAAAAQV